MDAKPVQLTASSAPAFIADYLLKGIESGRFEVNTSSIQHIDARGFFGSVKIPCAVFSASSEGHRLPVISRRPENPEYRVVVPDTDPFKEGIIISGKPANDLAKVVREHLLKDYPKGDQAIINSLDDHRHAERAEAIEQMMEMLNNPSSENPIGWNVERGPDDQGNLFFKREVRSQGLRGAIDFTLYRNSVPGWEAVELGEGHAPVTFFRHTLGMALYKSGQDAMKGVVPVMSHEMTLPRVEELFVRIHRGIVERLKAA